MNRAIRAPARLAIPSRWGWLRLLLAGLGLGAALLGSATASAAGRTNEATLSSPVFSFTLEPTEHSDIMLGRFFEEVVNSDRIVFDRFMGPSSRLGWLRSQDSVGYGSLDRFNARGASLFASIGLDSLRIAASDVLRVEQLGDRWQSGLVGFIVGSIGNPEEEHLRITSISYSDVRSSWESGNNNAGIEWGFRPWRTDPYLYIMAHAGHLNGQSLITFEGRAAYTLFGSPRLEGRVTLPLPAKFRLGGGVSVDPIRLEAHDPDAMHLAFTLERVIRFHGSTPDALFYVGFRSGVNRTQATPRPENLLVVGLTKQW
jgi:hypothetical protein